MRHHYGACTASLRAEYGVSLPRELKDRQMPLTELADLVAWLPAGSPFWAALGGPMAVSEESRAARLIVHALHLIAWGEAGSKGPRPEVIPPPPFAHEQRTEDQLSERKAEAYKRRQAARNN